MTRHLGRTVVVLAAVQSACKSRVNVNLLVISGARPRGLPLRGEERTIHIQEVPFGAFFEWCLGCRLEALRQSPVEGGLTTEVLDQSRMRYGLTVIINSVSHHFSSFIR